eukprot:6110914-Prymnesium_polylepis.1
MQHVPRCVSCARRNESKNTRRPGCQPQSCSPAAACLWARRRAAIRTARALCMAASTWQSAHAFSRDCRQTQLLGRRDHGASSVLPPSPRHQPPWRRQDSA